MGDRSKIEWTDATWNPWVGCTKVSEACTYCYMFRDMRRYGRDPEVVVRTSDATFFLPLKRKRSGEFVLPPGFKVFTCSWSDWFHERADAWRSDAWSIIRQRPDLIFQILTKRPERIIECLPTDWGAGYPNCWLGVTVENHERCMERLDLFLKVPAAVRFLSVEPLLDDLDLALRNWAAIGRRRDDCRIDWVIVGGESGPHARPMHPDWVRLIRDDCQLARVPFFFKQWGEWAPTADVGFGGRERLATHVFPRGDGFGTEMIRVGKKAAGRLLDGREWNEFPQTEAARA